MMSNGSRARILEVAREMFHHRGYLATSVDDIIAQAKVAKSNFYYHFKSKEELGIAVLESRVKELEALRDATLTNPDFGPKQRLASFLNRLDEEAEARSAGCPFGNLVAEMSEHSERFRCYLSEVFTGMTGAVEAAITDGQESGELRRDVDAKDAAGLIVHAVQGAHLMVKCHRCPRASRRSMELLVRLLAAH